MQKVKVGIVGCGMMAQTAHIPCLVAEQNAEITAICDFRETVLGKVAKQYGNPKTTTSVDELLSMDIDAVYVLTTVHWHFANIVAALKAGKSVFTEKPLTMCVDSARRIVEIEKETGKTVTVGYMKRHEANIVQLKKVMEESDWGTPLFYRTHSFIGSHWDAAVAKLVEIAVSDELPAFDPIPLDPGPVWLDEPRDEKFYSFDNPFFGLLDTGCHSINLMRLLADKTPKVTAEKSMGAARLVDFDFDGVPGTMEFCVNFNMRHWDEVTELYFEKGTVKIYTPSPLDRQTAAKVEIYTETGDLNQVTALENNHQWAFARQTKAFIESVQNGTTKSDTADAIEDISVIEEIYKKSMA